MAVREIPAYTPTPDNVFFFPGAAEQPSNIAVLREAQKSEVLSPPLTASERGQLGAFVRLNKARLAEYVTVQNGEGVIDYDRILQDPHFREAKDGKYRQLLEKLQSRVHKLEHGQSTPFAFSKRSALVKMLTAPKPTEVGSISTVSKPTPPDTALDGALFGFGDFRIDDIKSPVQLRDTESVSVKPLLWRERPPIQLLPAVESTPQSRSRFGLRARLAAISTSVATLATVGLLSVPGLATLMEGFNQSTPRPTDNSEVESIQQLGKNTMIWDAEKARILFGPKLCYTVDLNRADYRPPTRQVELAGWGPHPEMVAIVTDQLEVFANVDSSSRVASVC